MSNGNLLFVLLFRRAVFQLLSCLGWSVFSATDEVGCSSILCNTTYVCHCDQSCICSYTMHLSSTTFIAVILDYMGLYCEESWGLGWGHIYVYILFSFSLTTSHHIFRSPPLFQYLSLSLCTVCFSFTFLSKKSLHHTNHYSSYLPLKPSVSPLIFTSFGAVI